MMNVAEAIKARRSVRTFDGRQLDAEVKGRLLDLMAQIEAPLGVTVAFRALAAKEHGLICPVVTGTELYIGGKVENGPDASVGFGYAFEHMILYAQSLGLGTVWLGGTMNRTAFEAAMELGENEIMPCATPVGYTAKKMSVREGLMRKAVKADERLPFETLFFKDSFDVPLTYEKAGDLSVPLEMVRLAPSAVNKQPWRLVVCDDAVHFYLKRSKGFQPDGKLDMQMVDMGIALCHFVLSAEERGLRTEVIKNDPLLSSDGMGYVVSCKLI